MLATLVNNDAVESVLTPVCQAETPDMFADKWYIKFRDFLEHYYFLPQYRNETHPSWMCIFCIEGIPYVRIFNEQARRFSFKSTDYPKFDVPVAVEGGRKIFSAESQMAKMKKHPFMAALHVAYTVDLEVFMLEKVKLGGMMDGLLTWNTLPVQWRRAMNDIFLLLEAGMKAGWWSRPDFIREEMEKAYQIKQVLLKQQLGLR